MKRFTGFLLIVFIFFGTACERLPAAGIGKPTVTDPDTSVPTDTSTPEETATPENPPVPPPDYAEIAKRLLTPEHDRVYVGMADLINPSDYRYFDDPGSIHPASTIKTQIMEYALLQIQAGNGSLEEIYDGFTLKYLIERMIQVSCNDSTGSLIARYGRVNIDNWLQESYKHTRLNSDWRTYSKTDGRYNETSVEDTIICLERIWDNRETEPYSTMLNIMFGTTFSREKIPAATEGIEGVKVANKTGSFIDGADTADHDMAIVVKYSENGEIEFAYALTFYSFSPYVESTYSAARPGIVAMARDIYEQVAEFTDTDLS